EAEGGHVLDLLFDATRQMTESGEKAPFDGVTVIHTEAHRMSQPSSPVRQIVLIPYHLWANRGPGEMSVWVSTAEYAIGDTGPAGGLIFYINASSATDGWRYLEAAPVDQSAGARWGCFRTLIAGARGTTIGTGRQNTRDMLAACTELGTAADLSV